MTDVTLVKISLFNIIEHIYYITHVHCKVQNNPLYFQA